MIRAGIVGPTGYSGLELIRILLAHPGVELAYLGARREERPHIAEIWPCLRGRTDLHCSLLETDPIPKLDVVFLALPHTLAMHQAPKFLGLGVKVVDISADYRLKDAADYKKWYKTDHVDKEHLPDAVYGLCELFRDKIVGAKLIANPGCYPTATELALAPLLKQGLASGARIIVDAKSGVSGAGREPKPHLHYPEANESMTAYKVGSHQHTGEILQTARELFGKSVDVLFVPHLIPMDRGILATAYVPLAKTASTAELTDIFARFYADEAFVRVRADDSIPTTKDVMGTNFCDIAVRGVGNLAVVVSVIDNLVKGAAGQAVQNMNILFGLPETEGLLQL